MSLSVFATAAPERRGLERSFKWIVVEIVHFVGYYALLKRSGTRQISIAGFALTIGPTVYDPRY